MRVLVGKTFGIGNAVLSVPMVKALSLAGHDVDVLIGTGPDDFGAQQVFRELRRFDGSPEIGHVWPGSVPFVVSPHDVAVMSIPYDGRWRNGIDFFAHEVVDSRKRPGNVERLGFDMWERHEVLYQMENAERLGFQGAVPSTQFMPKSSTVDQDLIYLGIGFKRDPGGFGASKHIGNDRLAAIVREVRRIRPQTRFVSTGNQRDAVEVGFPITRSLGIQLTDRTSFYRMDVSSLEDSFRFVSGCRAYLGNDTGMMHVAASFNMPCFAGMLSLDLIRKNHPFCDSWSAFLIDQQVPVERIAHDFVDFVWGRFG